MAYCIPIDQEKIRGEVWLGGLLLAKTPALKSCNVNYTRNAVSTFSVTFDMLAGMAFPLGEKIVIKAGVRGNLITRATALIDSCMTRPAFGKPSYYSVTLQGRGVLSELENKKFSRRLKADGQGMFCTITGGPTNRPEAGYSLDKTIESGNHTVKALNLSPGGGSGEKSPFIVFNDANSLTSGAGFLNHYAKSASGGKSSGEGGLGVHDHTSDTTGGPAFGVYSVD